MTEAIPTEAFECVNGYLGRGEPEGGVWFVGLEESKGWAGYTADEVIKIHQGMTYSPSAPPGDWSELGRAGKDIRDYTSKILKSVSKVGSSIDWTQYRDRYLWAPGTQVFQANIFPIGKPNRKSWHPDFAQLFGFSEKDRMQYEEYVKKTRFKHLQELWLESKPQAVVCFGIEGWNHFTEIFLLDSPPEKIVEDQIHAHPNERVILIPFFAYGWVDNEKAGLISQILQEWEVSIF